jgi:predicted Zn-dependent protease
MIFVFPPNATAELDAGFLASARSLRRLTPAEAASARPLRIRLAAVQPGDTPETMAQHMPSEPLRLQSFRVLNGLGPADPLLPGQTAKVIGD